MFATSTAGVAKADLVAHYQFDSNSAADSGVNGLNGMLHGTTSVVSGIKGNALFFNNAWMEVPDTTHTRFGNGGTSASFSVAFWFKHSQVSTSRDNLGIITNYINAPQPDRHWSMSLKDNDSANRGRVVGGGGGAAIPSSSFLSPSRVDDDEWRHFVMVRDRSVSEFRLYIDGVQSDLVSDVTSADLYSGQSIALGNHLQRFHQFSVDDLRLYDHALSQTEIDAISVPEPSRIPLAAFILLGMWLNRRPSERRLGLIEQQ